MDPMTWFLIGSALASGVGYLQQGRAQKSESRTQSQQEAFNTLVSSLGTGGGRGGVLPARGPTVETPIASQLGSLMSQLAPLLANKAAPTVAAGGLKAPAAKAVTGLEAMLAQLRNPNLTRPQGSFQGFRQR
jgi:hypothetical protein